MIERRSSGGGYFFEEKRHSMGDISKNFNIGLYRFYAGEDSDFKWV
jgi:hypothetical protein